MLRVALALLLSTPAFAQSPAKTADTPKKVQFITMGDYDIESGRVKVPVAYMSARGQEKFARLVRLQHKVLPKMKATSKDVAFR